MSAKCVDCYCRIGSGKGKARQFDEDTDELPQMTALSVTIGILLSSFDL